MVKAAYDRSRAILERNRGMLESSAQALLAQESLNEDELQQVAAGLRSVHSDAA